jgi:hypothetical protein
LIGINQLVREVLLRGILPHLDPSSPHYSGTAGARLGLHPKELPEQDPMGLDPQESLTKMYEDQGMEDTIGIEVEVLDAVVPQQLFEEVAGREGQSALREPGEHRNLI